MSSPHLHFNFHIGRQKPESIINKESVCPFCDRSSLTDIIAEKGSILLVKNKYPVLEDTLQTVLIETADCQTDLSNYTKEHLYNVISFGIEKWLEMESSGEFASVLFFKNHGPKSGGTIFHPHMQIVGLKNINYRHTLTEEIFQGLIVAKKGHVEFNISTAPRVGFFEFNIIMDHIEDIRQFADYIQIAVKYTLHGFNKNCDSYNLFFYQFCGKIIAKIMPRFITSPIFIGFAIPQISNRIYSIREDMIKRFFPHSNNS